MPALSAPAAGCHGVDQGAAGRATRLGRSLSPRFPRLRNGDDPLVASSHPVAATRRNQATNAAPHPSRRRRDIQAAERVGRRVSAVRRRFASVGEYGES